MNENYKIIFTEEIWMPLVCHNIRDGYIISTYGNILDDEGNLINTGSLTNTYPSVKLYTNDSHKKKHFYIHRLVADTFLINDDPLHKRQVDHYDACKTNNFVANLEHVTQQENQRREIKVLKDQFAETGESGNFKFKFTEDQVHVLCQAVREGYSYPEALDIIGFENNVKNRVNMCDIITGRTYRDISSQYGFPLKKGIIFGKMK